MGWFGAHTLTHTLQLHVLRFRHDEEGKRGKGQGDRLGVLSLPRHAAVLINHYRGFFRYLFYSSYCLTAHWLGFPAVLGTTPTSMAPKLASTPRGQVQLTSLLWDTGCSRLLTPSPILLHLKMAWQDEPPRLGLATSHLAGFLSSLVFWLLLFFFFLAHRLADGLARRTTTSRLGDFTLRV